MCSVWAFFVAGPTLDQPEICPQGKDLDKLPCFHLWSRGDRGADLDRIRQHLFLATPYFVRRACFSDSLVRSSMLGSSKRGCSGDRPEHWGGTGCQSGRSFYFGFPPGDAKAPGRKHRKCKHRLHSATRGYASNYAPTLGQPQITTCRVACRGGSRRKPPPNRP